MSVYLGDQGFVELKRDSLNKPLVGTLTPSDVNTTKNRFSFDIGEASLISGDQVDISTTDRSNLVLVAGATGESYRAYVSVDNVGGIRLYETFDAAICDERDQAIALTKPTSDQKIEVKTRNNTARCVAQVTGYELTTNRDTVDITTLGEEFRRNYANGLISGQGSMECLWDYQCGQVCDSYENAEFPNTSPSSSSAQNKVQISTAFLRSQCGQPFCLVRIQVHHHQRGDDCGTNPNHPHAFNL